MFKIFRSGFGLCMAMMACVSPLAASAQLFQGNLPPLPAPNGNASALGIPTLPRYNPRAGLPASATLFGGINTADNTSTTIRENQVYELIGYLQNLKSTAKSRLQTVFVPNYTSITSFKASRTQLLSTIKQRIGYPPPNLVTTSTSSPAAINLTRVGSDSIGTYYRVSIPVLSAGTTLPTVNCVGIYIVPNNRPANGRVPLVIAAHGGYGSPEEALNGINSNYATYRGMVLEGVKKGYAVFAPGFTFGNFDNPDNQDPSRFSDYVRWNLDRRLRPLGTTLFAIEVAKVLRAVDVLSRRPEVDAARVAMIGHSYGGYYTLLTTALDDNEQIKYAVSSCFYGVQEGTFEDEDLTQSLNRANTTKSINKIDEKYYYGVLWEDHNLQDRLTYLRDSELLALICPRPIQLQQAYNDSVVFYRQTLGSLPDGFAYYANLGITNNFEYSLYNADHVFNEVSAYDFLARKFNNR